MRFGVLLPHFGSRVTGRQIADFARLADDSGFDSVWVRDHVLYDPHGFEADGGTAFVETFATLNYVASVTRRVEFGTAAIIPSRHPLLLAQAVASLSFLSARKVLLGVGAGHSEAELAAVGRSGTLAERVDTQLPEMIAALRDAWTGHPPGGPEASLPGLDPTPSIAPEIWYCGTSPKALRIAQQHCTGWAPGRITVATLRSRLPQSVPDGFRVTAIPLVLVGDTVQEALESVDPQAIVDYAQRHRWITKPEGGFRDVGDLDGLLLAGPAASFVPTLVRLREAGVTDVVLDLRLQPRRRLEALEELGEALHAFRRATA